jgi:hypothetical protein
MDYTTMRKEHSKGVGSLPNQVWEQFCRFCSLSLYSPFKVHFFITISL